MIIKRNNDIGRQTGNNRIQAMKRESSGLTEVEGMSVKDIFEPGSIQPYQKLPGRNDIMSLFASPESQKDNDPAKTQTSEKYVPSHPRLYASLPTGGLKTGIAEESGAQKGDACWQDLFRKVEKDGNIINGDSNLDKTVNISKESSRDGMIAIAFSTGGYTGIETNLVSYPRELGAPANGEGTVINDKGLKVYFFDLNANPFLLQGSDLILKFRTSRLGVGEGQEKAITLRLGDASL